MGRPGAEIEGFLGRVRAAFEPERVLLFGSRARGDPLAHSDYDIIVVSRRFEGVPFLDRIHELLGMWDSDRDLDILPYTPGEFEAKSRQIGIVSRAVKEGVAL